MNTIHEIHYKDGEIEQGTLPTIENEPPERARYLKGILKGAWAVSMFDRSVSEWDGKKWGEAKESNTK